MNISIEIIDKTPVIVLVKKCHARITSNLIIYSID
jgi:hypothetical protein